MQNGIGENSRERESVLHGLRPVPGGCAVVLLLTLLCACPWAFGGVTSDFRIWIGYAVVIAIALAWLALLVDKSNRPLLPSATAVLLAAMGLGALHMTPLAPTFHNLLGPRSAQLWRELVPSVAANTAAAAGRWRGEPAEPDVAAATGLELERALCHTGPRLATVSLYPDSTRRDIGLLSWAVAVFLLGALLFRVSSTFKVLLWLVSINGAALALFGLVQQLTWNGQLYWQVPLSQGGTPFASFVNRNNAAGYLLLCLAAALGLVAHLTADHRAMQHSSNDSPLGRAILWIARMNVPTLASLTMAGCIVAGILCSLSRGAWVALAVATVSSLLVTALARRVRPQWTTVGLIAVLALVLVFWVGRDTGVRQRIATLLNYRHTVENERLAHWRDGLDAAQDFWFVGSGLGTYRYVYRLYRRAPDDTWFYHAENQYLETLVEAGIVGLVLLLLLIGLMAVACWRLLQEPQWTSSHMLGVVGIFALVSQAVHAMFDFGLYIPANVVLFALLCGAVSGRAAALSMGDRSGTATSDRWLPRRLLVLSPSPFVAGSLLAALTCVAGIATADAKNHAMCDGLAAGRLAREDRTELDAAIATADLAEALSACESCAADARAQQIAADRYLTLYRLARADELRGTDRRTRAFDLPPIETKPAYLHGRIHQYARNNRTVDLADIRNDALVARFILPALEHLLEAREACPLDLEPHIRLAELCGLVVDPATDAAHLRRAAQVATGQTQGLFYIGLLHIQAGRPDSACAAWRNAIELEPASLPQVLKAAEQYVNLADRHCIEAILPDSPNVLILVASDYLNDDLYRDSRRRVLARAQRLLKIADVPQAERYYLEGMVLGLNDQTLHAVQYLSRAVELSPDAARYRYQLALHLRKRGNLDDAKKQATLCVRIAPGNSQYEQLLRELIHDNGTSNHQT